VLALLLIRPGAGTAVRVLLLLIGTASTAALLDLLAAMNALLIAALLLLAAGLILALHHSTSPGLFAVRCDRTNEHAPGIVPR
jgi:hypothetical protein